MKEVISRSLIFKNCNFKTQEEVFSFLSKQLKELGRSKSEKNIKQGFYDREKEFSTCVDKYIAIPHCRHGDITEASVAIVINDNEIAWTEKQEKVKYMFALMIPESNENQIHIRILAQLAQMIMQEEFLDSLLEAENEDEIYEIVKDLNKEI